MTARFYHKLTCAVDNGISAGARLRDMDPLRDNRTLIAVVVAVIIVVAIMFVWFTASSGDFNGGGGPSMWAISLGM